MSNLHKDLDDLQLHNPKGFAAAANDTKLCKNSRGNLEWKADTGGGGGGVTRIVAGTNITISPTTGLGDVTINSSGVTTREINQTFRACATYTADPKEKVTQSNMFSRQVQCSNELPSVGDMSFSTDTRAAAGSPLALGAGFSLSQALAASEYIAPKAAEFNSFNGVLTAASAGTVTLNWFLGRPDCENYRIERFDAIAGARVVAVITEALVGKPFCFDVAVTTPLSAGDILLPLLDFSDSNSVALLTNIVIIK